MLPITLLECERRGTKVKGYGLREARRVRKFQSYVKGVAAKRQPKRLYSLIFGVILINHMSFSLQYAAKTALQLNYPEFG